jgi:hypothetical protein
VVPEPCERVELPKEATTGPADELLSSDGVDPDEYEVGDGVDDTAGVGISIELFSNASFVVVALVVAPVGAMDEVLGVGVTLGPPMAKGELDDGVTLPPAAGVATGTSACGPERGVVLNPPQDVAALVNVVP